jgi:hypothetical protein
MTYTGECACGRIRFAIDRPLFVQLCHCEACKRRTGSAYGLAVGVEDSNVRDFVGETKTFTRIGESGKLVHYEFCPNCGTTVRWRVEVLPGRQVFAGGTFDDLRKFDVSGEMYTDAALSWARIGCELSRPGAPDDEYRNALIKKSNLSL